MSVFIIINSWQGFDATEGTEVVGANYFTSESSAWDALNVIAESYNISLHPAETSFTLEDQGPNIEYEEYYIQELTLKH